MRSILRRSGPAILLALFAAGGPACAPALHNPDAEIRYTLRIDPDRGIAVTCRARGLRDRRPEFQLLSGLGMLQRLPDHIEGLSARDGGGRPLRVEVREESARTLWRIHREGADEIDLLWRIRPYDPFESPEATFLEARRALLLGYTAFPAPTELTDYLPSNIVVEVEVPEGWPLWTSWSREGDVFRAPTLHHLWSGGLAAGSFRESRLTTGAAEVTVLSEANWTGMTGLTVANRLVPSLRAMVDLFGAPPRDDSLRVLAVYRVAPVRNGKSLMVGVSEEGSFFCMATPDRFDDLEELTALAVHECLHFYLGGALTPEPELPYNNAPDLAWFVEGVTEYLTYRLMNHTGVLSDARLARVWEKKRAKMESVEDRGPISLATAARLLHEPEVYELVYTRGCLLAGVLEEAMDAACGAGSFDGALRDLFERRNFHRTRTWIRPEDVEAAFSGRCANAGEFIRRYARGSEPLPGRELVAPKRQAAPEGAAWIRSDTGP